MKNLHFTKSYEVEELEKLIESKLKYLSTLPKDSKNAKYLQKEILFLQNDILPSLRRNTIIVYSEYLKYCEKAISAALEQQCNGVIIYLEISDKYEFCQKVGIANKNQFEYGKKNALFLSIINDDGTYTEPQPINLLLNDFMQ